VSLFGVPFLAAWTRQNRHPKTPSIGTFLAGHLYLSKSTAHAHYAESAHRCGTPEAPITGRNAPGSRTRASQNRMARMVKIGIYVGHTAVSPALAGTSSEINFETCYLSRECASIRDGTDFIQGSSAVAEPSLGVLSLVLGPSVGRSIP